MCRAPARSLPPCAGRATGRRRLRHRATWSRSGSCPGRFGSSLAALSRTGILLPFRDMFARPQASGPGRANPTRATLQEPLPRDTAPAQIRARVNANQTTGSGPAREQLSEPALRVWKPTVVDLRRPQAVDVEIGRIRNAVAM